MSKFTLKDLDMPDDEPMVIIRSSLLWICDGDKYAAAALNMYIHWTRWLMKRKPVAQEINKMLKKKGQAPTQDTTYIIYRKQQYLVDDLLGFCSDRRLRQANDLLQSKGLLKIEDTPRHLTDHVLKYELQIGVFKKLMDEWRKQREENGEEMEDEEVEVSLEADLDGTDKNPSRSGKLSEPSSSRNGKLSDSERINVGSNNIDNRNRENRDDNRERTTDVSQPNTDISSPPLKNPDILLMDTWDDICGERIPRDRKHKEAAAELARCGATREDLINNRDFCLRTNPQWYEKNGVDLAAIARNWGKWKSSLSHAPKQQQPTPTSAINPNSNKHLAKYFTEEELAEMGVN